MQKLVEVAKEKGMEKYSFTASGIGCRFWVGEVVRRWTRVGLVEGTRLMGCVWDHDGTGVGEAVGIERWDEMRIEVLRALAH